MFFNETLLLLLILLFLIFLSEQVISIYVNTSYYTIKHTVVTDHTVTSLTTGFYFYNFF